MKQNIYEKTYNHENSQHGILFLEKRDRQRGNDLIEKMPNTRCCYHWVF
ncbi:MAG: hypothetical protein ACOC2E_04100 [Bacteroidota bacterium]